MQASIRRTGVRLALLLGVLGMTLLPPGSPAGAKPDPGADEPMPPSEGPPPAGSVDLATADADRWIVQLAEPSTAEHAAQEAAGDATAADETTAEDQAPEDAADEAASDEEPAPLDVDAESNASHRRQLEARQRDVAAQITQAAPGARVDRTYQIVLNGMAVSMSSDEAAAVRDLPGVVAVTPDLPFQLDMYATPEQIGAPALWEQLGGQAHAGEGVKVAIIDSGIYVTYDGEGAYAGNPCFDDAGYTAPAGYPVGDTRFTNDKVIAARAYFRPDDPPAPGEDTPIQGTASASPHGTHVAGTVACNAGTVANIQGVDVTLSGVAPRAYLMNYRVFYPSSVDDDFQNGNAYVAELVQAIEDAVVDGADVISNSWGSSYQNTLAWPDPMVQASEAAVDAGVVMVYAQGNSGPDHGTGNAPSNSPKVISVGAVTKSATLVPGEVDVTAPAPVPPELTDLAVGPAQFGAQVTTTVGPAPYVPAEVASGGSTLGCAAFPAGSLNGAIALIERGTCEFSVKVFNAQQAGAVGALVYNSAANGDNLQAMGPGAQAPLVTIPSWFMRRSEGLAMAAFATANEGEMAQFTYAPQATTNIGDVMAGFSSRGPTQDKTIKPDVVAPGVDVISGGYAVGEFPVPFTGFGSSSGTSMATPHVAGAAALLLDRHPDWRPRQVKSALMTTATEEVFLDTAQSVPADVLDRGAGRIDVGAAADAGLTLSRPSLSAGERTAGEVVPFTIRARNVTDQRAIWDVSTSGTGLTVTPSTTALTVRAHDVERLRVRVTSPSGAEPGDYYGSLVLTHRTTGQQLHVPIWLGVRPTPTTDVLLVDDDGSAFGFTDYADTYTAALDAAGVTYDYLDAGAEAFPDALGLYAYRAVVMFTGDNDSFDTSGLFLSNQDGLAEWLDSGGRLWLSGQNQAEATDSNASFASPRQGRARLYHGYLGLRYESGDVFGEDPAPTPTAEGAGPMAGIQLDLGPDGLGADNQESVEASTPFGDNDTFQGSFTTTPLFHQIGGNGPGGSAISFARGSEPSLEERRVVFRYRSISMGFGLEGVNGADAQHEVTSRALAWLLDDLAIDVHATRATGPDNVVTFTASQTSGAPVVRYRWDFGDGSPIVTTLVPTATHAYAADASRATVEATDVLGHRAITRVPIRARP